MVSSIAGLGCGDGDDGARSGGNVGDCLGRLGCGYGCCGGGGSGRSGRGGGGGAGDGGRGLGDGGRGSDTTRSCNGYCSKGNRSSVSHTFPFFKGRQDENWGTVVTSTTTSI